MAQIGDQLALAAGRVLRSGKVVLTAMSSPKKGDGLASGSPSAPPSQGPANVSDELTSGFPNEPLSPGQADFGEASSSPMRLLRRMRTALARVGGGRPADSVEPSSLTFQGFTLVRPKRILKRPAARPSEVESQADDDDPFIVLTETKFSFRCIPVWIGTLLTGLGSKKKHM